MSRNELSGEATPEESYLPATASPTSSPSTMVPQATAIVADLYYNTYNIPIRATFLNAFIYL